MQKHDIVLIRGQDIPAALGLLTRIPVKVDMDNAQARGAAAAWAYPLAGLVVGMIVIALGVLGQAIGLAPQLTAGLMLTAAIVVTGGMHEDGLADSADGLWGGWDRTRRLEIMKDSHIGAYGVIALILSFLIRWSCLTLLVQTDHWIGAVLAVAMLSRAAMVALMTGLPNARASGLSQSVGRPRPQTAWLAIGVATLGGVLVLGLTTGTLVIVAAIVISLCAGLAHRKIGGQTGDILGATQQATEIALLITLTTL